MEAAGRRKECRPGIKRSDLVKVLAMKVRGFTIRSVCVRSSAFIIDASNVHRTFINIFVRKPMPIVLHQERNYKFF